MSKALVVVDMQNDFCPGGTLAVDGGDEIVNPVNRLVETFTKSGFPVYFTRDWHTEKHSSFKALGGIWPPHCIAGSDGAKFHKDLFVPDNSIVISKAFTPEKDAYSGFEDTDLDDRLKNEGVDEIIITGLATDYCVKNTVLDALSLGYRTIVAEDCIRAVNVNPGDGEAALKEMADKGAITASSNSIL